MRIVEREIVGAFIFSADNKVLLGYNKKGGAYQKQLVVPGGGIEPDESDLDALKREILEEVGLDISAAQIDKNAEIGHGESTKVDPETGEEYAVHMNFHDFTVKLPLNSDEVKLTFNDDFETASFYTAEELEGQDIGPASLKFLTNLGFLAQN